MRFAGIKELLEYAPQVNGGELTQAQKDLVYLDVIAVLAQAAIVRGVPINSSAIGFLRDSDLVAYDLLVIYNSRLMEG